MAHKFKPRGANGASVASAANETVPRRLVSYGMPDSFLRLPGTFQKYRLPVRTRPNTARGTL
eukprot:CAMPEP_0115472054 /NCGR_PEP_ID=MMETSP0271-20121206/52844_1 /TAXON_ID=71861 /ORGANISM="Scrippsiella trochoidea, Strain CCMP3099" /LENGTH=61 /DNA_ID=CAMNT_0002899265 /DNA_START=69 /DNA_END=251 /DNA_ORIENTATION=+